MKNHKNHTGAAAFAALVVVLACIFALAGCTSPTLSDSSDSGDSGDPDLPGNVPSKPVGFQIEAGNGYATLKWAMPNNDGGSEIMGYQISGGPTVTYASASASWVNLPSSGKAVLSFDAVNGDVRKATLVIQSVIEEAEEAEDTTQHGANRAAWLSYPTSGMFTKSAVIDELDNNTSYTFEVRAVNANGGGASSGAQKVTPNLKGITIHPNAPGKPLNFTIDRDWNVDDPVNGAMLILKWTKPNDKGSPITEYEYASIPKNDYDPTTYMPEWRTLITDPDATECIIHQIFSGRPFTYRIEIRAVNAFGGGESSDSVSITPPPNPFSNIPSSPLDFVATAGNLSITLKWTTPQSNGDSPILKYQYYSNLNNSYTWTDIPDSSATTTQYTFNTLEAGKFYQFAIRAVNANGNGSSTFNIKAYPLNASGQGGIPSAPRNLKAVPGDNEVVLTWDPPLITANITKYQYSCVRSGISSDDWKDIPDSDLNTLEYTVGELINSATYRIKIRACTTIGGESCEGADSAYVLAAPAGKIIIVASSKPVNFKAANMSTATTGKVYLTWTLPMDGPGVIKNYQISFGPTLGYTRKWNLTLPNNTWSYTANNLTIGTAYTFEIRTTYDNFGETGYGEIATKTATPKAPPMQTLPDKVIQVMGKGYDVTTEYAKSDLVKAPILDLEKIRQANLVIQDLNQETGDFVTVSGSTINEYTQDNSTKVNVTASGGVPLVGSFSASVTTSFSSSRTERNDYSFATSRSSIVKDAWFIARDTNWKNYLDPTFAADVNGSMTPAHLIAKYGTHVMTGVILGARLDYNMSAQKKLLTTSEHFGIYVETRAKANISGFTGGLDTSTEVDKSKSSYYNTESVETRVYARGGDAGQGQLVATKGEYTTWINSIKNTNIIWVDYYRDTLVPIWQLADDHHGRGFDIAQYYREYSANKGIVVSTAMKNGSKTFSTGDIQKKADNKSGDNDVASSKNKRTSIELEIYDIKLHESSFNTTKNAYRSISFKYKYDVYERGGDDTHLQMEGEHVLDLGGIYITALQGDLYTKVKYDFYDEQHGWLDANGAVVNSPLLTALRVKIDDNGTDRDHLHFDATLKLNYVERVY